MSTDKSVRPRVGSFALHALLVPFPIVCFIGALITDLLYWQTASFMWTTFSIWLLTLGLIVSAFAVLTGAIDFIRNKGGVRNNGVAWVHAVGNDVAVVLALVNAFVHSRDGWTTVMPEGLILSALTVLILFITVPLGKIVARRQMLVLAGADPR